MTSRRLVGLAALAGLGVALVLTFPLLLRLGTTFLDDGSYDAYQFSWNLWWVRESLCQLHTNPFFTSYLFYPDGVPLLFHTLSFSLGLVSLPLQTAFGLVTAHNLLVIAAPALTVLLVALLAREITGDPAAAVVGGMAAATSPVAVYFLPVLYLSCVYLIVALLLAWRRLQRTRRAPSVALALGVLAVLLFASQEYAVIALALLALDTAWRALAPRSLSPGPCWLRGITAFWSIAALGLGALALAALSAPAVLPPELHLLMASGYAAGFVTPPWLVAPPVRLWGALYLGTAPIILLPFAVALRGRHAAFWLLALVATALMALGPEMHASYPLHGFTWREVLESGRFPVDGPHGPYFFASKAVPLLRFIRTPFRWIVGTQVALAVLVALAVAGLRGRVADPRRRAALTLAMAGLVLAGAAVDARGLGGHVVPAVIPASYRVLQEDPEPSAVLDLPSFLVVDGVASFSSLYMYYQTAHRKFLLEGTVARVPPGRLPVLWRKLPDFPAMPWIKYVVIHRDLLPLASPASREQAERLESLARAAGTLVADEAGVAVYRLRTFRPESVR